MMFDKPTFMQMSKLTLPRRHISYTPIPTEANFFFAIYVNLTIGLCESKETLSHENKNRSKNEILQHVILNFHVLYRLKKRSVNTLKQIYGKWTKKIHYDNILTII